MPKYSKKTLNNQKEALNEALLEIERCQKTKSKSLSIGVNGYLNIFPDEIRELTWLTSLSVYCTGISIIPDWIDELKDLKILDLSSNNKVRKLPLSIGNLKKLKKLILGNMGLKELPEFLGNLISLEFLEICPLKLKKVPQCILDLPKLRRIEARGYDTSHLPSLAAKQQELDRKECLQRIEHCNKKKNRKLDLSFLYLEKLPEELGALNWLEVLDLTGNNLKLLPEWIGNFSNLKILNLDCNELSVLPDSIGKLSELKSISLDENRLETLPDTFGNLKSLEVFALWEKHNHPKLEEVYGQGSWFTHFPESFGNLGSLKTFTIGETKITRLPESFGNLTSLTKMTISECFPIDLYFPESMRNLENLNELSLSGFSKVPDFIYKLKNLKVLDISHNKLHTLPDFIGNLTKLKVLNLHSTWITELPEWVGNLKNLEELDISANDINKYPNIVYWLPKLKEFCDDYNPFKKAKPFQYCKNKLDNELWKEFNNVIINEIAIKDLILKGANINSIDLFDDSLLDDLISNADDSRDNDMKAIGLLLDAGADINYIMSTGFNCLHSATVPWRMKIFKMLLERGINPNSMNVEYPESVLDNMLLDEWICRDAFDYSDKDRRKLMKMIKLLIAHGGKKSIDLHTEELKKYLVINALYPTGLVTWDGFIEIQNLPNITPEVKSAFLKWKKLYPILQNENPNAEEIENKNQIVAKFNIQGMNIAKCIKNEIGPEISIRYIDI